MEFKIKCSNCNTVLNVKGDDKIDNYLCKYLLNEDNKILRCCHIACNKCRVCWWCRKDMQKFHSLLE